MSDATTIADASGQAATLADGLMSVADAARFLAVGRTTLYQEMDAGRLVYVKLGRARRIPKRALLALAAANLRGGWAVASDGGNPMQ